MECPRCHVTTTVQRIGAVEMDICRQCGGMFLDRGELNKVSAPTSGDLEYSTVDLDSFEHEDAFAAIACPRCGHANMNKVEFNIYSDIILDYCERCEGFWLDGRELNRVNDEIRELNEASREEPDPPMLWFAKFLWTLPH
jgi:Zn-finger nucleic acid-binding protein